MASVEISEICPEKLEKLNNLAVETLKTIHEISRDVSIKQQFTLIENIRLEHEILMKYIAYLLNTHVDVTNKAIDAIDKLASDDTDLDWGDV